MIGKISSELNKLDELNAIYEWIPSSQTIRPTDIELSKKFSLMEKIENEWNSSYDYILHKVFRNPYIIIKNKKHIMEKDNIREWAFVPAEFRYNLPYESKHYVLWNSQQANNYEFSDKLINNLIFMFIHKQVQTYRFNYAWYKNPKPSIDQLFHVQVFWTLL